LRSDQRSAVSGQLGVTGKVTILEDCEVSEIGKLMAES